MMASGSPISPLSRRRTSNLPSDPVPPVTNRRLPSSGLSFMLRQLWYGVGSAATSASISSQEGATNPVARRSGRPQGAVVDFGVVGDDLHIEAERVAGQAEEVVLGDPGPGHLVEAGERRMVLDEIAHYTGHLVGGDARVDHPAEAPDGLPLAEPGTTPAARRSCTAPGR